jgi:HEAT repeat protein
MAGDRDDQYRKGQPLPQIEEEQLRMIMADLRHVSKERRRTAIMRLGMMGGDDALGILMQTVEDGNEDLIVRARAALMLGRIGDERAVSSLIRALDVPGYQTRLQAVESLGLLGDLRAIGPLRALLATSNDRTRDTILRALERLEHEPQATPTPDPDEHAEPTR